MGHDLSPGQRRCRCASDSEGAAVDVEDDVGAGRLQHVSSCVFGHLNDRDGGLVDRNAADLQRPGPTGSTASFHLVGIAVANVDLVEGDAGDIGSDLGKCRVVALAVVGTTRQHQSAAVGPHLDTAELGRSHRVRDLDVGRPADAEQRRTRIGEPTDLLGSESVIVRGCHDRVERGGVFAGVHIGTGRGLEGEGLG